MRLAPAILLALAAAASADPGRWEPEKTYVLMAGVLEWKDKNLSPFPKDNRQDRALEATLKKAGVPEAQWEQTMTLASLVEAEAKLDVDRPKVARVFLNRIANTGKAPTYGLFQSDASLAYGLKKRVINLTQSELQDQTNPYNLRYKPGPPPTPISNPGAKGSASC